MLVVLWTRFLMRLYRIKSPIVIIYEPRFSSVLGRLGEALVWYEIADDRLQFTEVPRWIESNINLLIEKADVITVSSRYLYERLSNKRTHDIYFVGNGVETEHFRKALNDIEIPEDIRHIKKPIVGYIGAIGEWFDFQLIERLIRIRPDLSVVLIGPIIGGQEREVAGLCKHSNFHVLGKKPYESLPNYIKAFSVCIIPFKVYELTRAVNPTKFYEYLACAKPVVSTALPDLLQYRNVAYIAESDEEFLSYIDEALTREPKKEELLKIAQENTWDKKVEAMMNLVARRLCLG